MIDLILNRKKSKHSISPCRKVGISDEWNVASLLSINIDYRLAKFSMTSQPEVIYSTENWNQFTQYRSGNK